jgi:Uri superfamily endonuclease
MQKEAKMQTSNRWNFDQFEGVCQPIAKGTYLLVLRLGRAAQIQIGALGLFGFPAGWYIYAGSAMGPGGLRARLARHSRAEKRLHWHIDYVLAVGVLQATWQVASLERLECAWATAVSELPGAQCPALGFGSSDCGCPSHLVYLSYRPTDRQMQCALAQRTPPEVCRLVRVTATSAEFFALETMKGE